MKDLGFDSCSSRHARVFPTFNSKIINKHGQPTSKLKIQKRQLYPIYTTNSETQ